MGAMSDLHLLSSRVLAGETVSEVASDSAYPEQEIAWATADRLSRQARHADRLNEGLSPNV